MKTGDTVNYHAIIKGKITSTDHVITDILYEPNDFGCDVAWITKKRGCVALSALSLKTPEQKQVEQVRKTLKNRIV